jgi:hypothetical protein
MPLDIPSKINAFFENTQRNRNGKNESPNQKTTISLTFHGNTPTKP